MKTVSAIELYDYLKKFDDDVYMTGDGKTVIDGISSYDNYKAGSLTWIKKDMPKSENKQVTAIVLSEGNLIDAKVQFFSKNPKYIFFKAAEFLADKQEKKMIADSAVIAKTAQIAENVCIGNFTCIGENVIIGENTNIASHVIIADNVEIGNNCNIKSGAIIGERGFGYSKVNGEYQAVPHFGKVIIGDNVDIGNNTCIDQGTIDDTVIGSGTKIDNLCHIAHNVKIEENCCIIANSTIAGSVKIGKESYIALSASILNQKIIGHGVMVGSGALVTKDMPQETVCAYSPAKVIRERTKEDKEKY